jgi:hypothetical protein
LMSAWHSRSSRGYGVYFAPQQAPFRHGLSELVTTAPTTSFRHAQACPGHQRHRCLRTSSPAFALGLVVVARIPSELTEQIQHVLLPRDDLLRVLVITASFIRSPLTESAQSISSESRDRLIGMCRSL